MITMLKRLLLLFIVLSFSSPAFAAWKFNVHTGKPDYYEAAGEASMVYPGAGVAVSTGTGWDTSIAANTIIYTSAIGSTVQAYDADLTTYAGITPSANAQTLLGETFAQMLSSIGAEGADANIIKSGEIDTSAELLAILTDETGSASGTPLLVFNQSPVLVTPKIDHIGENTGSHGIVFDNPITARVTPRIVTTTDDATAVIDVDVTDQYQLTAVANATEFSTTGTPTAGQKLLIRFKDAGGAKAITWNAVFTAVGVTAPTTTTAGKTTYVGCIYNATDSKWNIVAVGTEA